MSLFEKINVITERKYLPNDPSSKKSPIKRVFGKIFSNKAKDIRQAPGDPLMGPPGLDYNDPNDLPSNKLGKPTYKNIPKGSLPKPSKPKAPIQLPPAKTSNTIKKKFVKKTINKQTELNLGNTKTTNVPLSTKRTLKGRPLGSKTTKKPKITQPTLGVNQSDVSKKAKDFTSKVNKANKNRKEFEYAKSKESKTFKGTVTQGANKGRNYRINRNPPPKGIHKNLNKAEVKLRDAKSGRNMKTGRLDPKSQDLAKRAARGEPKAVQFTIDMRKDYRRGRGLGKRGERKIDASGGKKTGSLRKGNLSFPGDRTGAYSRTKTQIDFDKALIKARGGTKGDIAPEAPKSVKDYAQSVRDKRIKKLGTPDPFEVDTSKAAKQSAKTFGTPTKSQIKKLSKTKIGGYRAPTGGFGKGLTPGEFRGKQMDVKAFKKTTTKDILTDPKLSKQYGVKSFQKFSRDLQDFKDRDMPGGPRKTTTTKPKTSGVTLSRQDVGMAPPDTPRSKPKTNTVPKSKQQVKMSPDAYKKTFEYSSQTKFLNKKTGQPFNMANPGEKNEYLRQQGKKGFLDQKSNKSKKTFKKMQQDLTGSFGNRRTFNMTDRPASTKNLTRGFKGQLGKRAFAGKVAKGLAKRPGLTGALTIAGLYAGNELRKAFFGPKAPKREKIKITPPKDMDPKSKTYGQRFKKFSEIPQNQLTKTDKELMNVGRSSISPAALKQMGKGGRYDPGKGFNLKKYSQSDAYKDTLRQIRVKTGKKNLDPYKVFGNKK